MISTTEIRSRVEELGPWFHNLDLNGVRTAPGHFLGDYPSVKWDKFRTLVPEDLQGASVLDIGCNAGFYSIEMHRRGAGHVLGIDSDEEYLNQARFAAEVVGADIEFRNLSVYDVGVLEETFDIVLFMGVVYHLRHPLLALDLIHAHVARGILIFQSMQRGSDETFTAAADYEFADLAMEREHRVHDGRTGRRSVHLDCVFSHDVAPVMEDTRGTRGCAPGRGKTTERSQCSEVIKAFVADAAIVTGLAQPQFATGFDFCVSARGSRP